MSYILFVCVMPVRTSNLKQAWSTSVVAFQFSLYYPQIIIIIIIKIIIIIIIITEVTKNLQIRLMAIYNQIMNI